MPTWAWVLIALVAGGVIGGVGVTYYIGHGMFRNL